MNRVFKASAETRHFTFEAFAADGAAALAALEEGLANHGREHRLPERWWDEAADVSTQEFAIGRGYRDGTAIGEAIGGEIPPKAVARAHLDTERFGFEAYGRTRAAAKSALTEALRAHGAGCAPPLRRDWWRLHYDLSTDEYLLGVCYRDLSPVPATGPDLSEPTADAPAAPRG